MQGKISSPRLVEEITPQTPPRPVSVPPEPPQAPRTPVTVTYSRELCYVVGRSPVFRLISEL